MDSAFTELKEDRVEKRDWHYIIEAILGVILLLMFTQIMSMPDKYARRIEVTEKLDKILDDVHEVYTSVQVHTSSIIVLKKDLENEIARSVKKDDQHDLEIDRLSDRAVNK